MTPTLAPAPATHERPIFVIGPPRSGTTLLRLMLTSHPLVCIPPESLFYVRLRREYSGKGTMPGRLSDFVESLYREERFRTWRVERAALVDAYEASPPLTYAAAVTAVYRAYAAHMSPAAQIWGDKNPAHLYHLQAILTDFPRARAILILRDPRAVYHSLSAAEVRRTWQGMRSPLLTTCKNWRQAARVVRTYQEDPRFLTLHYERLVAAPERELRHLCAWLDLDFDAAMLRFHEENARKELVPRRELSWHARTLEPVTAARANAWRDRLSVADIEALELFLGRELSRLGYSKTRSGIPWRGALRLLLESGRFLVLAARCKLTRGPRVLIPDQPA